MRLSSPETPPSADRGARDHEESRSIKSPAVCPMRTIGVLRCDRTRRTGRERRLPNATSSGNGDDRVFAQPFLNGRQVIRPANERDLWR
jgi:hypothetical protein